jgi:hypothetical protein
MNFIKKFWRIDLDQSTKIHTPPPQIQDWEVSSNVQNENSR